MAAIGGMDADAEHVEGRVAESGRGRDRRCETKRRPARPGDDRPASEPRAACRRPDAEMILGDRDPGVFQCRERAIAVQPGRRDEAIDRPSDDIFQQRPASSDAPGCILARETEELALACGQEASSQAIAGSRMRRLVAMEIAVQENFRAPVRPPAQARCKGRARDDRRVPPVVRHHEHRHPAPDIRR